MPPGAVRAVTVNVSAASPGGDRSRRVAGMVTWANRVLHEPEPPGLVFAQECSDEWLEVWATSGYQVIEGDAPDQPRYRARSALLVDQRLDLDITQADTRVVPTLAYHGSYVAAATWAVASEASVLLMSVHASPSRAERHQDRWPSAVPSPVQRRGVSDPGVVGGLWDADAVLATLVHQARQGPVLAAGDLNEALGWDNQHPGETWGEEFFQALRAGGLASPLHDLWGTPEVPERATRMAEGQPGLQLDHVVTTEAEAGWIREPELDPDWAGAGSPDDRSDHIPVWFEISAPGAA